MSVSLPKSLKEYIKRRTKQEHYGTPSDYIRSLVREDLKRSDQEQLEKMLLGGLASGQSVPMGNKAWSKVRTEVNARSKKRS